MVHYGHNCIARTLPPVCPKCGSHRTQVVGESQDRRTVVRCSACGERSPVAIGEDSSNNSHTPTVGPVDAAALDSVNR